MPGLNALTSLLANARFFAARWPGTPLRVLSLMGIDAALRSRGRRLGPRRRRAVIRAMELGALLNDRFDGDVVDRATLRGHARWFRDSPYAGVVWAYAKRLRGLERHRPPAGAGERAIKRYREDVNRLSLALLWALARPQPLARAERAFDRESDLRMLFRLVMLAQVIDDSLDVELDRRRRVPSFANAAGAGDLAPLITLYGYTAPIVDRDLWLRVAVKAVAAVARLALRRPALPVSPAAARRRRAPGCRSAR